MRHKHHKEKDKIGFDPERQEVVGLTISFEDLEAWIREFKNAGFSQGEIEQKVEQSVIDEFLREAEKRYGQPFTSEERAYAVRIFLEKE